MNDTTKIMVKIDIFELMNKTISRIAEREDFCYPDGKLKMVNAEMVLLSIGQFSKSLSGTVKLFKKELLDDNNPDSENNRHYPVFLDYMSKMANKITAQKDFCYPDEKFSENRVHTTLQVIGGIHNSHSIAASTILQNMHHYCDINLEQFLNGVLSRNIKEGYQYAYPNGTLSYERSHNALGVLQSNLRYGFAFVELIKTDDLSNEFKKVLKDIKSDISDLHDIINEAYPNNQFNREKAHPTLGKFIDQYMIFQKSYLRSLEMIETLMHKKDNKIAVDDIIDEATENTLKIRKML